VHGKLKTKDSLHCNCYKAVPISNKREDSPFYIKKTSKNTFYLRSEWKIENKGQPSILKIFL